MNSSPIFFLRSTIIIVFSQPQLIFCPCECQLSFSPSFMTILSFFLSFDYYFDVWIWSVLHANRGFSLEEWPASVGCMAHLCQLLQRSTSQVSLACT
jgi:hypothetical protein